MAWYPPGYQATFIMHEREVIQEIVGAQSRPEFRDVESILNQEEKKTEDVVNHPSHYTSHPSRIECLEITRHLPFSLGNAIKYLWRAGLKGGPEKRIEDWKKARFYLQDHQNNIGKVFETFNLHLVIARFHTFVKARKKEATWEDCVIDLILSLYDGTDLVSIRRDLVLTKAITFIDEKIIDAQN